MSRGSLFLMLLAGCGRIGFDPVDTTPIVPPSGTGHIAAGGSFTCAARADGSVWCWGSSTYRELGVDSFVAQPTPIQVATLTTPVVTLSAGDRNACAIDVDGGLWCWGDNSLGELGIGSTTVQPLPIQVPLGGHLAVDVVVAGTHACVVLDDTSTWCWGANPYGEVGFDPGTGIIPTPIHVIDDAVHVVAGENHSCVLVSDGGVWCWGANSYGVLADNSNFRADPEQVQGLPTVLGLASGDYHMCALVDGGRYACWGNNGNGELGYDPPPNVPSSATPAAPSSDGGFVALTAGSQHTCGIHDDSTVECWGLNVSGQIGTSPYSDEQTHPTPVAISGTPVGLTAGGAHSCVIRDDDTAACWGYGSHGELGDGKIAERLPQPVLLNGVASSIAVGDAYACAIVGTGAYCWGSDTVGQLGDNGTTQDFASTTPILVTGLLSPIAIAAGRSHVCALTGGAPICWGGDYDGELGDNDQSYSKGPTTVLGLPARPTAIAAGGEFTCAIVNGSTMCWGRDDLGQIGDGGAGGPTVLAPTTVGVGTTISISAGAGHACSIDNAAQLWCWGDDTEGQLGDGATGVIDVLPEDYDLMAYGLVAAGADDTCASSLGGLTCWGDNSAGQLGVGTYDSSPMRNLVTGDIPAAYAGGTESTCMIDGQLRCWGDNSVGEIGDGTTVSNTLPTNATIGPMQQVLVGDGFACALASTGAVSCWGENSQGQIGNGKISRSLVPDDVLLP